MLYLAATPYSASAALVAVREERQAKAASRPTAAPTAAAPDQESLAKTKDSADGDPPQQEDTPGAEGASPSSQGLGATTSREALNSLEVTGSFGAPTLVKHPVYFVSTVLRDARAEALAHTIGGLT